MWTGFLALCANFLVTDARAQSDGWTTATSSDGKVTVRYSISEQTDERGEALTLIQWDTTTTDETELTDLVAVMKDVTRHQDFLEAGGSEKIKAISDHEWVIYYLFPGPGPIPDSDCVVRMVMAEDAGKSAVFTLTAAPSLLESKGMRRCALYDMSYAFRDTGDGRVEVHQTARVTPTIRVPQWLIRTSFPRTPLAIVARIVELSKGAR